MPNYTIIPVNRARPPIEITAQDGGAVLHTVSQLGCGEADVFQEDAYSFSVRLSERGLWSIFQRQARIPGGVSEFG